MKYITLLLFLTSCSSTRYWTNEEIKMYTDGFFHGCTYVESRREMNLNGLIDCENKRHQLIEYYKRVRVKE